MIRVFIIEDEGIAANRLMALLEELDGSFEIVGLADSIKSAIRWFQENEAPDLAFFDIQLADGKSFEIFDQADVTCPIVFTTAYDQYAIQAFKVNSIDYLLKPISKADLKGAIEKFKSTTTKTVNYDATELLQLLSIDNKKYKERFVVKVGEHLKSVVVSEIGVFLSEERTTFAVTMTDQKYILDYTLDRLEPLLDPKRFFRVSRKYIVSIESIKDILTYSSSRLKLTLKNSADQGVIVSRERVNEFKNWLDR